MCPNLTDITSACVPSLNAVPQNRFDVLGRNDAGHILRALDRIPIHPQQLYLQRIYIRRQPVYIVRRMEGTQSLHVTYCRAF